MAAAAAIVVVVAVRWTTTTTTTATAAAAVVVATATTTTVRRVGRWRTPYVLVRVLVRVFVRERGWSVARVVVSKMKSDSKPLLTAQAEKANHYT